MFESICRCPVHARGDGGGPRRAIRRAGLTAAALALGACSQLSASPDMSARLPSAAEQAGQGTRFPNLGSVPDEPPAVSSPDERRRVMEGLIADRANAEYTDEILRPGEAAEPRIAERPPDIYSILPGAGPGDAEADLSPPDEADRPAPSPATATPAPASAPEPAVTPSPSIAEVPPSPVPDLAAPVDRPSAVAETESPAPPASAPEQPAMSDEPAPETGVAEEAEVAALPPDEDAPDEDATVALDGARILFGEGSAELSAAARAELAEFAERLIRDENARVELLAYASDDDQSASFARRLSLSRAIAVRRFLIQQGVPSRRMDVRALGDQAEDAPLDRVDVLPRER